MTASGLAITRVGQVAINVQDLGRATAFYRDVLGLKFLFAAGQLAFFDCGGVRLMLDKPENAQFDHPSSIVKTTALHGLADLTRQNPDSTSDVIDLLRMTGRSGTPRSNRCESR